MHQTEAHKLAKWPGIAGSLILTHLHATGRDLSGLNLAKHEAMVLPTRWLLGQEHSPAVAGSSNSVVTNPDRCITSPVLQVGQWLAPVLDAKTDTAFSGCWQLGQLR